MKINYPTKPIGQKTIDDIGVGECFLRYPDENGPLYMKTETMYLKSGASVNAVCLENGSGTYLYVKHDIIILIKAEVEIKE